MNHWFQTGSERVTRSRWSHFTSNHTQWAPTTCQALHTVPRPQRGYDKDSGHKALIVTRSRSWDGEWVLLWSTILKGGKYSGKHIQLPYTLWNWAYLKMASVNYSVYILLSVLICHTRQKTSCLNLHTWGRMYRKFLPPIPNQTLLITFVVLL